MYNLLISDKKYQAALDFSYAHGLDKDEVYKSQWLQSEHGINEINTFLKNIKDQDFVLSECVEKVGSTEDAVKALLEYGLHLTEQYRFSDCNDPESTHIWNFRVARLKLLQFKDKLETFLGIKMGRFSVQDYTNFRILPISKTATTLAEGGKIGALNFLFKRHPYSLATSMLSVLSAIPETVPVPTYEQLLPGRLPPSTIHVREKDWVECDKMMNFLNGVPENHEIPVQVRTEPIVQHFLGSFWPSADELCMWYKKRARDIDVCSGQLDNCHFLVDFACRRGLCELQPFCDDIYYLHELVYFYGNDGEFNFIMNLVTWEQLSNYEKFKMLLMGVRKDTVVERLHTKAIPFMRNKFYVCKERVKEDCSPSYLVKWLKEIAVENKLDICLVVLEEGSKECESDGIFTNVHESVYCALECIYLSKNMDRWSAMASILSKLSHMTSTELTFKDINKRLELAEGHVEAGRLLAFYQVPKPMSFLLEASLDEKTVKQIIRLMLSKFMRRHPSRSDNDWANMWRDLQFLHEKAFPFLDSEYILVEFCRGLLKAGRFSLARNYLKGIGSVALAPEKAENLVIQSAREYFFSASTLTCLEIWNAKECLSILPSSKNIKTEMDLIDAITVKLPDLGVTLLPMQFRQIKDPMEIIKMVITNQPGAFLEFNELIEIAKLLGLNSAEDISSVEESIAREAAVAGDLQIAFDLCLSLCRKGHGRIWDLCAAIARGPALENIDIGSRKQLLGFALCHCDENSVGEVLHSWKDLDMQEQCEKLMVLSNTDPLDFSVQGSSTFAPAMHHSIDDTVKMGGSGELLGPDDIIIIKNLVSIVAKNSPFESGMDWESFLRENEKALYFCSSKLPWLIELSKKGENMIPTSVSSKQYSDVRIQAMICLLSWVARNGFSPSDDLIASLSKVALELQGTTEDDGFLGFSSLNISEDECGCPKKRRQILMKKFKEKKCLEVESSFTEEKSFHEMGSSGFTTTLIALKSSQLATAILPALKISPDDLLNVDTAFSCFLKLSERAVTGPDVDVLLAILENWEALFKSRENDSVSVEESEDWSHDGWEDGWESFQEKDLTTNYSIHPLKNCWLEILKKFVMLSRFNDVLNLMDRYLEDPLLDEDCAGALTRIVLKSNCFEAFEIALLLPYEPLRSNCLGEVERALNRDGIPEGEYSRDLEFLILVLSSGIASTIFGSYGAAFSYVRYLVGKLWHEQSQSQSQSQGQREMESQRVFREIVLPYFVGEVVKEGQHVVAGFMVAKLMGSDGCVRKYLEMELGEIGRGEEKLGFDGCLRNCVRRLKGGLGTVIESALSSLHGDAASK